MSLKTLLKSILRNSFGPVLLALQVALTLAVLVNVAYIVVTRMETTGRPTGMDLENVFWVQSEGYAPAYDQRVVTEADLRYLNSLPGVTAATISSALPQTFGGLRVPVSRQADSDKSMTLALVYQMTEKSVDALGLHLVRGRLASAASVLPPPAAGEPPSNALGSEIVITDALARHLFEDSAQALGKPLFIKAAGGQSATIVGIVAHMQAAPYFGPDADFVNYVVLAPSIPAGPTALYLVRSKPGSRDTVMQQVEREFEALQPGRYVSRMGTLQATAEQMRAVARGSAVVLLVISSFVLGVTILGLFGFATFAVASRTKQIGTRRAIGATKADILKQFILENWIITTMGCVVGAVLTLAFSGLVSSLLQIPRLPLFYLLSGVVLMWVVGFLAVLAPASRAANVAPAVATRIA